MDEIGGSSEQTQLNDSAVVGCEMCANYEIQLQTLQTEQDTLREQLAAAKELYEKYGKELTEERQYRKELEGKFALLNEETESKIQQCLFDATAFEERLSLLGKKQEADMGICFQDLELAKNRQKEVQKQLVALNERYQKLLRTNAQSAEEMREQQIELPQTVEELQFLALQLREDLITERTAREHVTSELRDELAVAREQLLEMEIRDKEQEEMLIQVQQNQHPNQRRSHHGGEIGVARSGIGGSSSGGRRERTSHSTSKYECSTMDAAAALGDCCPGHHQFIADLESQLSIAIDKCARLEELLAESKQRCSQMQNELDTSETVQKDFVRLSQQLQIELEKIRQSEVEVRWQEPEDVSHCSGCNKKFPLAGEKKVGGGSKNSADIAAETRANCKHCGKIFCSTCLAHKVQSGPNRRPVCVCVLCHSLLSKEHSLVGELKPE